MPLLKFMNRISAVFLGILSFQVATGQNLFSISSDIGAQRNFKKEQRYWAFGHTATANFHITAKDGVYAWFAHYSPGHYKNNLTATAKSIVTIPQEIDYVNEAKMRLKQVSLGYKRYLKGKPDQETSWNLYAYGGFGLILGRVDNVHSVPIDTLDYNVPVRSGRANFKRLTVDLGAGWEYPIGADFYLYTEGKVWIPTTAYPSEFIFVNRNAPFTGMLVLGLRLLF